MLKKPSIHELLIKAADSISRPVDNLRIDIKDKIEQFVVATDRSPTTIHLTKRQVRALEWEHGTSIMLNINTATVFGIPLAISKKFRVS